MIDNYILTNENAIYYESGYSSDNAIFLRLGSESYFITDSRYEIEAKEKVIDASVIITSDLYKSANTIIGRSGVKKLIFDPKEWSLYAFERFSNGLNLNLIRDVDFSQKKRIIKSEHELEIIAKSVKLGAKAFDRLSKYINRGGLGKDEFELTYMAKKALSNSGKYELSFDPIVAINGNASKPHALPTDKILKCEDLLLVDAGLKYKRYCSDRTRTVNLRDNFSFDREQKFKSKKIQKAYDAVLKAHDKAIAKARSGMRAKDIDRVARDVISKAGFGRYFVHSTGHGVGLDIHEMPYISPKSNTVIEDGMVYTIEPGVYILNEFGIRVEDMVSMVEGRAVIL